MYTQKKKNRIDQRTARRMNKYILLYDWEGNTGNILFEIDRIGPTEGRDDTEVENRIFPRIAQPEELQ